jgi:hypothetical protein
LTEFIGPVVANKAHRARLEWVVFIVGANARFPRGLDCFLRPRVGKEAVAMVPRDNV